jgi:hypothetical protein
MCICIIHKPKDIALERERMPFHEKLLVAKQACIVECRELISSNWENIVLWLPSEGQNELFFVYKGKFRAEFPARITNAIGEKLYFAVQNLIFAMNAFMFYTEGYELEDVLDFTECFMNAQLDNFESWCEDDEILEVE